MLEELKQSFGQTHLKSWTTTNYSSRKWCQVLLMMEHLVTVIGFFLPPVYADYMPPL